MSEPVIFPARELSERQAARYIGLSYETFRRLRMKGHVKPTHVYPIGGRRYSIDDLQAFADRYRVRRRAAVEAPRPQRHATKDQLAHRSKLFALAKLGRTS